MLQDSPTPPSLSPTRRAAQGSSVQSKMSCRSRNSIVNQICKVKFRLTLWNPVLWLEYQYKNAYKVFAFSPDKSYSSDKHVLNLIDEPVVLQYKEAL